MTGAPSRTLEVLVDKQVKGEEALDGQFRKRRALICLSGLTNPCLLYTSDAADERSSVDLGGRRIIKKKNSNDL